MTGKRQEHLLSHLKSVWRRGQLLHITAGLLAFCRWAIPLLLTGIVIDWFVDLPAIGRVLILVSVIALSVYKAWQAGWRHARRFDATLAALQVEQRMGDLESLLVTAVQLGRAGANGGASEPLRELTLSRAEETASRLSPSQTVRFNVLRRPVLGASVAVLIVCALAIVTGPLLLAGATRMFAPWLAVQYPTRTHIKLVEGDLVVREGDPATIEALVSGVIPGKAKLALRTGTGAARVHQLAIDDGKCRYTVDSVFRGFEYQVIAGDARSAWHTVQVIPPPRIERAEVRLEFPEYTDRPAETAEALTVVVPENTGIQWRLTLDRAVSQAQFVIGDEEAIPLEISDDGRVVTLKRVATESRAYNFSWVERDHGFAYTSPRYYVQVSPDQRPNVELTSPRTDLYATLGRKLDLAFRGRDDYGLGESVISYRVNKTGEAEVAFPVPSVHDGSEQRIDWDYRTVLPDLAVGDSVTFAVELADKYPGANGPQRARSDARRITFLSQEQYLEQIAKQKQRLLSQLQTIYREERAVHDLVRRLDPLDEVFVQTCQLEAVRQDLMRERLGRLSGEMSALIDDLAANNITDETQTAVLARLASAIQGVADEHVGVAAENLRALASVSGNGSTGVVADPAPAVMKVNTAARELGLLVLELGYKDAAEVMARELHATAQTQASLRLKTILPGKAASDAPDAVADAQEELKQWLTRLLAATPREQESTPQDALVAFGLVRLSKQLLSSGVETKMNESAALVRGGGTADAARRQAEIIQALLRAEFRLRYGSEYEALSKAHDLLVSAAETQKALRTEIASVTPEEFAQRQASISRAQSALERNLQLVLMPEVPAARLRLFETTPPSAPPVHDLLSAAVVAMKNASAHISERDRDAAVREQTKAEESFAALALIVQQRLEAMTRTERLTSFLGACGDSAAKLGRFKERLLVLVEKTDDAATDRADPAFLADPQRKLREDVNAFREELTDRTTEIGLRTEEVAPLSTSLDRSIRGMSEAGDSLEAKQAGKALQQQQQALSALNDAEALFAEEMTRVGAFVKVSTDHILAMAPGPYVADIIDEQRDLIAATRRSQPAAFARLVMPQKNLVHAVNAVLFALDPLAHKVDSGTGMLFAKTDMDSAAAALDAKDASEAIDAQTAVADSVQDLQTRLAAATPQYGYILDITEFVHGVLPETSSIRLAQGELRAEALAATDEAAVRKLVDRQRGLESRAREVGKLLSKASGQEHFQVTVQAMTDAAERLAAGDKAGAMPLMQRAEEALVTEREELLLLLKHLGVVLSPPVAGAELPPELKLLYDVLPMAARHREFSVQAQAVAPDQLKELAAQQREFAKLCETFIAPSQSHPKLVEAKQRLADAAAKLEAGARAGAFEDQQQASDVLRHFVIEYITKYVSMPPPPSSQPPAPSDEPQDESDVSIFMPGAVTGRPPKTGRVEWEVLGRRERAALNENFARELPLEYRAILKDYYERLTR